MSILKIITMRKNKEILLFLFKIKNIFFGILIFHFALNMFAQNNLEFKIDSLRHLDPEQIIQYVDNNNDLNEVLYKNIGSDYTVFSLFAHNYGFLCDSLSKELVYYIIAHAKKPIYAPLFFVEDPCYDRISDLLEYFDELVKFNHPVNEIDFIRIINTYYKREMIFEETTIGVNYQNEIGKTPLMYACALNYTKTVKNLISDGADLNITDKNGKTALMYACNAENLSIVRLLRKNNCDVSIKDKHGKTAINYCKSIKAKKMLEE